MNEYRQIPFIAALIFLFSVSCARAGAYADSVVKTEPNGSHFLCKDMGNGRFKPYYMEAINDATEYRDWSQTPRGLLGQNAMASAEECERAIAVANNQYGIVCSRTGLDGWKPTIYTGTTPGRADFGYMGGSSIMNFEQCLAATLNSSERGVCYWGGSAWYVSPPDRAGTSSGPYRTFEACVEYTKVLFE